MYDRKPTVLKRNTLMYEAFKVLSKDFFVNIKDFPVKTQKVLWSGYEIGLLKIYKNGLVRLNASGKKLLASASPLSADSKKGKE
jgi:hypothetical protein